MQAELESPAPGRAVPNRELVTFANYDDEVRTTCGRKSCILQYMVAGQTINVRAQVLDIESLAQNGLSGI
jgi:hypothetical protein